MTTSHLQSVGIIITNPYCILSDFFDYIITICSLNASGATARVKESGYKNHRKLPSDNGLLWLK